MFFLFTIKTYTNKMIYKYFYDLDEIAEWATPDLDYFFETLKETLWNMGEALWHVDYSDD